MISFPHNRPIDTPVIAEVGQLVYNCKQYRRQGRIVIEYCKDRPGQVQVQWFSPTIRMGWIMLNRLRCKNTSKKLIFKK
jgi:hypothetical protein